jgi:hypothetical protein
MLLFLSLLPPSEKPSSEGQYTPSGPAKKQATQIVLKGKEEMLRRHS